MRVCVCVRVPNDIKYDLVLEAVARPADDVVLPAPRVVAANRRSPVGVPRGRVAGEEAVVRVQKSHGVGGRVDAFPLDASGLSGVSRSWGGRTVERSAGWSGGRSKERMIGRTTSKHTCNT